MKAKPKDFTTEKAYQRFIIDWLVGKNGYVERTDADFDRAIALDRGMLLRYLEKTQPKEMATLRKRYGARRDDILAAALNAEMTKPSGGALHVLKHGLDLEDMHLELLSPLPPSDRNPKATERYEDNVLSVAEEVWASDRERIDLVVFANGIPVAAMELKANGAGQDWKDAVAQWKRDRDPATRLLRPLAGCIVLFALDQSEIHMTTTLARDETEFLPFNRGRGEGADRGAGNDAEPGKYPVAYLWEDVLRRDTLVTLLKRFVFLEEREEEDAKGRKRKGRVTIFPRWHQLDCVRELLADVRVNRTARNYLVQHSAGSGKTNTIAWLSYRLASLYDTDEQQVFDNVVVITDRVVVDRQLQKAITQLEHKTGQVRVMDEECTSKDLAKALDGNTKIVAATIQKFPWVLREARDLSRKRFAVIVDEAHSSTAGRNMLAVKKALGVDWDENDGPEEILRKVVKKQGKPPNVATFAFTATPKAETLQLFGTPGPDGKRRAFHLYSMKQAIEEGFILDVLKGYVEYRTWFEIVKKVENDPVYRSQKAASAIKRFAMLHDTNVRQRVEILVEHFRECVMDGLSGEAKGMVVTASRVEAVKYKLAIDKYLAEKGYDKDMKALVAFSGTVRHLGRDWTERGMNGFGEKELPARFKRRENRLLVVADKYQTGFDEKRLAAMYVFKGLAGIAAVQTLSRLNRPFKPYDKRTFVLDFANTAEGIAAAFAPWYAGTSLARTADLDALRALVAEVEGKGVLVPDETDEFWNAWCSGDDPSMASLANAAAGRFAKLDEDERDETLSAMRRFVDSYGFVVQAVALGDEALAKADLALRRILACIDIERPPKLDLRGKIDAQNFVQERQGAKTPTLGSKPDLNAPGLGSKPKRDDPEERLSKIIRDLNSRYGKNFDPKIAAKGLLQIQTRMLQDEELRAKAASNTLEAFRLPFGKAAEGMISSVNDENAEFFDLLLKNRDARETVVEVLSRPVWTALRRAARQEAAPRRAASSRSSRPYDPGEENQ